MRPDAHVHCSAREKSHGNTKKRVRSNGPSPDTIVENVPREMGLVACSVYAACDSHVDMVNWMMTGKGGGGCGKAGMRMSRLRWSLCSNNEHWTSNNEHRTSNNERNVIHQKHSFSPLPYNEYAWVFTSLKVFAGYWVTLTKITIITNEISFRERSTNSRKYIFKMSIVCLFTSLDLAKGSRSGTRSRSGHKV